MKDIDIKAIIARIESAAESESESAAEITRDKIKSDIGGITVGLCNTKKALSDIQDYINLDSATDNKLQVERLTRLNLAINYLQDTIESLVIFCDSNK